MTASRESAIGGTSSAYSPVRGELGIQQEDGHAIRASSGCGFRAMLARNRLGETGVFRCFLRRATGGETSTAQSQARVSTQRGRPARSISSTRVRDRRGQCWPQLPNA